MQCPNGRWSYTPTSQQKEKQYFNIETDPRKMGSRLFCHFLNVKQILKTHFKSQPSNEQKSLE